MDLICKSCKKAFNLNPIEVSSASVNFNLGRNHTFKCDHCKTGNMLTKAQFEDLKKGKQPFVSAAPAAKPVAPVARPVAKPVAAAKPMAKPVAKPVAAASKPVARPMPAREIPKDEAMKPMAPMAAGAQREGTVKVASLHVRKDHSTTAETVAGLVKGNKVKILATWTDGKNTWAQIGPDQWAAVEHNGKKMIEIA